MRAAFTASWLSTGSRMGQVGQVCWSFSGGSAWIREISALRSQHARAEFKVRLIKPLFMGYTFDTAASDLLIFILLTSTCQNCWCLNENNVKEC